ncbi:MULTISPECIES: papain fold toxin domain-containing protein [unclassified Microcoleus]|uniref:papain fold toxin domain-containing protein n=1 Tax=unclassified Microcoleus TaxID=2642155 RepID=UPI002FD19AE3
MIVTAIAISFDGRSHLVESSQCWVFGVKGSRDPLDKPCKSAIARYAICPLNGNDFEIYLYLNIGGKLYTLSLDPSSLDEIREDIAKIASRYGVFQCVECSQAIKEFLTIRNLNGKQIKLDLERQDLPWSVIYDLRRQQQIATNGYHQGISITIDEQEIVFDNIDCSGVNRQEWLQNLTSPTLELGMGSFKIIEEEF